MSEAIREIKRDYATRSFTRSAAEQSEAKVAPLVLTPELRVLPEPEPQPTAPSLSLQETIAELEATLLAQVDDWDGDQDEADPATPAAAFASAPQAAPVSSVIDEDKLRATVAELVRAEMRGELGVKITHSVRKLVRAEIARALASQNLRLG